VANFSQSIQGFSVDPNTGATTPLKQGPVTVGDGFTHWFAADPAGRFLFVSSESIAPHGNMVGHDEIGGFRIDAATGNLTAVPNSPVILSQAAGAIVTSHDGRFLYMAQISGIAVYAVDQTSGMLTLVPGSPFVVPDPTTLNARVALAIAPSGEFLYEPQDPLAVQQSQIAVYSLNTTTGIPTPVTGSPFKIETLFFPDAVVADPKGRFLYTGGEIAGPNVDVQLVSPVGAFTPAPGSPFPTDDPAFFMSAEPSGRFLYVASGVDPSSGIYAFSIASSSGALTPVPGSPFAPLQVGPFTIDQTGRFLYITTGSNLLGYTINPSSGALTPMPGNSGNATPQGGVITVAF
jgi:6-phosphogluconolactonase (cycloisomerase 2 family)